MVQNIGTFGPQALIRQTGDFWFNLIIPVPQSYGIVFTLSEVFTQCLKRVNLGSRSNIVMKIKPGPRRFFLIRQLILENLVRFLLRVLEESLGVVFLQLKKEKKNICTLFTC